MNKLKTNRYSRSIEDRLIEAREIVGNCWIWTKSKNVHGYGTIKVAGKNLRVHRVSYEEFVGKIPDGSVICHKCDTPACFNPDHLFAGTQIENVSDMKAKGRQRRASGVENSNAKVSPSEVFEIRKLRASGKTLDSIGKQFGIAANTVSVIANGKTWGSL